MLSYALEKLSEMHILLGDNISEYQTLPEKIKASVRERCFDEASGFYADSPDKSHFSQHTQVWAVLCNMERGNNAGKILTNSAILKTKISSAYMFLLFRALEKSDMYYMSGEYLDSLRTLVDMGCTTTPEWIGEDVRSECHAWSAVAIYEFTAKILGVSYKNNTICVAPYVEGRSYAMGEVATPVGNVYVAWKVVDDIFTIDIKVPDNKKAILTMPDGMMYNAVSGVYTSKLTKHFALRSKGDGACEYFAGRKELYSS